MTCLQEQVRACSSLTITFFKLSELLHDSRVLGLL